MKEEYKENTESTINPIYSYKRVEFNEFDTSIELDIFDIPGQELYRSLCKNFFINSSIAILVYDVRRR